QEHSGESFPRVFLAFAASWQSLQAYPIAGTQVATATALLVVTYAVCLREGLRAMGAFLASHTPHPGPLPFEGRGRSAARADATVASFPPAREIASPSPLKGERAVRVGVTAEGSTLSTLLIQIRTELAQLPPRTALYLQALATVTFLWVFTNLWCKLP